MGRGKFPPTVVERLTGAQVLPPADDSRAVVSPWFAFLACDADLRARAPEYREIAYGLEARRGVSDG